MTKTHLITRLLYPTLLAALIVTGFGHGSVAHAQSSDISNALQTGPASRLAFGGDPGIGILPPVGQNGLSRYFSGRTRNRILLGTESRDTEQGNLFWLEFDSTRTLGNSLGTQIGLGYAPSSEFGFAVGPFLDLGAAKSGNIGIYQTGGNAFDQDQNRVLFSEGLNTFNDAGLAASLSYMPLQDIWIGLHGSVSRNLSPTQPDQSTLDGIDAMLGLTARYRIAF